MIRARVRRFVRGHARLDEVRRAARFYQDVPLRDLRRPRKLLAAGHARRNSLVSYARLSRLYELASSVGTWAIAGSIVECGVCNGGSAAVMALAAQDRGDDREIWLFDSWEGLPEPGELDISSTGTRRERGWNLGSERAVEALLFENLRLPRENVHLVKGWFQETLPRYRETIAPIALLHLDGDWYESTKTCLEQLYDAVSPGGVVAVDDYGHWQGCKQAVDEFLQPRAVAVSISVDGAIFFRKPR